MTIADDSLFLDLRDLQPFITNYKSSKAVWEAALRTTLNRLSKVMNVETRQQLSKELKMNGRDFKRRMFRRDVRMRSNGQSSSIWYGTAPIPMGLMHPRKTASGVSSAASGEVKHAFIRNNKNGTPIVFVRKEGAKHKAGPNASFTGTNVGKMKQKLERVEVKINDHVDSYLATRALGGRELREQFFLLFDQELLKRWGRRNAR